MTPLSSTMSRLRTAAFDNPIVDKDALTALRNPRAVTAWVTCALVLGGGWFFAWTAATPTDEALRHWSAWTLPGIAMALAVIGLAMALVSLIAPVVSASAIAGERERGTMPLLTVTSLRPGDIVIGKLAALVLTFVPMWTMMLPLLAATTLFGGVRIVHVAAAAALVFVHALCLFAVGIGASTVFPQARVASIASLVVGAGLSLVCAMPVAIEVAGRLHGVPEAMTGAAMTGVVVEVACAIGALLWARSNLAPRSTPRWHVARAYAAVVVVGIGPLVALVSGDRGPDDAILSILQCASLVVPMLVGLVVSADQRGSDAPGPARAALTLSAFVVVGSCLTSLVPVSERALEILDVEARNTAGRFAVTALAASSAVMVMSVLAASSRLARRVGVRLVIAGAVVAGALVTPFALAFPNAPDETASAVLNPALAFDRPASLATATIAFHVVASAILLLLAALPRKRATHA